MTDREYLENWGNEIRKRLNKLPELSNPDNHDEDCEYRMYPEMVSMDECECCFQFLHEIKEWLNTQQTF